MHVTSTNTWRVDATCQGNSGRYIAAGCSDMRPYMQEMLVLMQIDLVAGMMDCLYAECIPCITDCVVAELEKLGQKYRVALKVAKVRLCKLVTSSDIGNASTAFMPAPSLWWDKTDPASVISWGIRTPE